MIDVWWKKARSIFVILCLYSTSTFGSICMLLPCLFVLKFNRRLFHTLCDAAVKLWLGLAVFFLEHVCRIKIVLHESKVNRKSNADADACAGSIIVMNHRTRLDWLFYFCILYRQRALMRIKIILKDMLRQIPGPGWAMQAALFIFIRRKWELDRLTFSRFIDYYHSIGKSVSVLIFPEGTNVSPETMAKSNAFAALSGLPPYSHVLYPRVTGFAHVFARLRRNGRLDCIQDVSVAYRGGTIPENEAHFLNGQLPNEIHFFIDTFQIKSILAVDEAAMADAEKSDDPSIVTKTAEARDETLKAWLNERWNAKEKLLEKFYKQDEDKTAFAELMSKYETRKESRQDSCYLFAYAFYWLVGAIIFNYAIIYYSLARSSVLAAIVFLVGLQLIGSGLDEFIINS